MYFPYVDMYKNSLCAFPVPLVTLNDVNFPFQEFFARCQWQTMIYEFPTECKILKILKIFKDLEKVGQGSFQLDGHDIPLIPFDNQPNQNVTKLISSLHIVIRKCGKHR